MRRPVLYLAGLLLATGASLAIAGPAAATVSHDNHKSYGNHWVDEDECDEDYDYWYLRRHHRHHYHGGSHSVSGSYNGIHVLSNNTLIGGLL